MNCWEIKFQNAGGVMRMPHTNAEQSEWNDNKKWSGIKTPHILIEYSIWGYCEMPQFLIAARQLCPSAHSLSVFAGVSCERTN